MNLELMKLVDVYRISDYMEWELYYSSNPTFVISFYIININLRLLLSLRFCIIVFDTMWAIFLITWNDCRKMAKL